MALSLLDTFRALASFEPKRRAFADVPWEAYVDWAIGNGLAPLAAYNLEYRLGGADAPDWARDRLLSVYQGALSDNVMKLVNFKRAVDELEGRRVVLLGAAGFAEVLYPHVAFRPVPDLHVLLPPDDVQGFANFLGKHHFRPDRGLAEQAGARGAVSDGRTPVLLHAGLFGPERADAERALLARALPARVYGSSFFRPDLEDALLLACHEQARAGYEVPFITFVDLRELVQGATALGGPYARPPDADQVRERARALRLERALFVSLAITERLFPETESATAALRPKLPFATRALLERAVVQPVSELGKLRLARGIGRLRKVLMGARE